MNRMLSNLIDHLQSYPNVTVTRTKPNAATVQVPGMTYTVTIDDFDEDDDDPIGDEPMTGNYFRSDSRPDPLTNHVSVLSAILYCLAHSDYRSKITGLTTDGDNHDCEAIFKYDNQPTIIKIR
jgi:hypothetical protein